MGSCTYEPRYHLNAKALSRATFGWMGGELTRSVLVPDRAMHKLGLGESLVGFSSYN